MIPLNPAFASATSGALTWSRISCNKRYELKLNGELVGEMTRPSIWSQSFVAGTHQGHWTFRRSGFFATGAEIVDAASQQQIASFKSEWGSRGVLTLADGQVFGFTCQGWWRPVWTVATESGQPVMSIDVREKTVELATGACVPENRLSLLIMFALYRIQRAEEDAASAVVVAAVS
jgi:hypothetical protein